MAWIEGQGEKPVFQAVGSDSNVIFHDRPRGM
jgi:hypothetical protein